MRYISEWNHFQKSLTGLEGEVVLVYLIYRRLVFRPAEVKIYIPVISSFTEVSFNTLGTYFITILFYTYVKGLTPLAINSINLDYNETLTASSGETSSSDSTAEESLLEYEMEIHNYLKEAEVKVAPCIILVFIDAMHA